MRATPATEFLQSEPSEGIEPTENTEVYVLYDEKNLYIGAMLYDSDQDGILDFQKQRDDGRTGYFFETNPAGLLGDGLIRSGGCGRGSGGRGTNKSWDGIWDVRTSKNDKGWIAEARIPFSDT